MSLGFTDGSNNFGLRGRYNTSNSFFIYSTHFYGKPVGTSNSNNGHEVAKASTAGGITTDPAKSGMACKLTIPTKNTPSSSLSTQKLGQWAIKYM